MTTSLQTQLSGLQNADLAHVPAQLSAAQRQLQASYHVIARLSQLSLAKYVLMITVGDVERCAERKCFFRKNNYFLRRC
jgi:hypothetical protein